MTAITALFGPSIRPRITILEQRLDAIDRARRALAALRTTDAPSNEPNQQHLRSTP